MKSTRQITGCFLLYPSGVYRASGTAFLWDFRVGRRNTPSFRGGGNRQPPMAIAPPFYLKNERECCGMENMTAKQMRFCDEYLIDLNATQAAIRAGYSEKSARAMGAENLSKPYIKAYIAQRMAEKEAQLIASQDEVLKYLTAVMRSSTKSSVLARTESGAEVIIEKPPDEKERLRAAELLGKRYGLYTDRIEQEVDMDLTITVDYGDGDPE
jgi:phage terminase small subunit